MDQDTLIKVLVAILSAMVTLGGVAAKNKFSKKGRDLDNLDKLTDLNSKLQDQIEEALDKLAPLKKQAIASKINEIELAGSLREKELVMSSLNHEIDHLHGVLGQLVITFNELLAENTDNKQATSLIKEWRDRIEEIIEAEKGTEGDAEESK